jgi:hypothetical protein
MENDMTHARPEDEPLLEGLSSPPPAWPETAIPRELHDALLKRTGALVRRRATVRRGRFVAAATAAYAAGLATMWAARPAGPPPLDAPRPLAQAPSKSEPPVAAADDVQAPQATSDLASLSPAELREMVPGAPRSRQIRLLQLAGDRYLYGAADVSSAFDCYRQVLELTPPDELGRTGPQDSWLLAELKRSAGE